MSDEKKIIHMIYDVVTGRPKPVERMTKDWIDQQAQAIVERTIKDQKK